MSEEDLRLPGLERVKIIGGRYPILMEIADPAPDWLVERLTKEELIRVMEVGIRYRAKLVEVERSRLGAQAEALDQMQEVIQGLR
jgi:hypothetical protein